MKQEKTHKHKNMCMYRERVKSCFRDIDCDAPYESAEDCTSTAPGLCGNYECLITFQNDSLKLQLEEAKENEIKLKALNNEYRTLLLGPASLNKMVEDGTLNPSNIAYIVRRANDACPNLEIDTILTMMQLHERMFLMYSQYCNQVKSRVSIKEELKAKTKRETDKALEGIAKADAVKKEKREKQSPYEKTVSHYMKMGMSREAAEKIVQSMGLTK